MVDQSVIPDISFDRDLTYFSDISGMLYKVNSKINASNGQDLYYHIGVNVPKKWKFKVVMYDYITKSELKSFEKDDSGVIEFTGKIKVDKNMKIGMVLYAYDYFSDVWVNKDFIGFWYVNVNGESSVSDSTSNCNLKITKLIVDDKIVYKSINPETIKTTSDDVTVEVSISNSGGYSDNAFVRIMTYKPGDLSTIREYNRKFTIGSMENKTFTFDIPIEYDKTSIEVSTGYGSTIQDHVKFYVEKEYESFKEPEHQNDENDNQEQEPLPDTDKEPLPQPEPLPSPQPTPQPEPIQPIPKPDENQIESALVLYLYRDLGLRGVYSIISDGKNTKSVILSRNTPYYVVFSNTDKQYYVYLKKWLRWKGTVVSKDNPNALVRGLSWIVYVVYLTGDKARELYNKIHNG